MAKKKIDIVQIYLDNPAPVLEKKAGLSVGYIAKVRAGKWKLSEKAHQRIYDALTGEIINTK